MFIYDSVMPLMTISEVANQIGLRPSAIRYYEQIGILPPAHRVSGQRRYDVTALHRLTLIQKACRLASHWKRSKNSSLGSVQERHLPSAGTLVQIADWVRLF